MSITVNKTNMFDHTFILIYPHMYLLRIIEAFVYKKWMGEAHG